MEHCEKNLIGSFYRHVFLTEVNEIHVGVYAGDESGANIVYDSSSTGA